MNPKTEELLKRTFDFGVNCLLFLESLTKSKVNAVITFQLAKASTSIGSNYEEAQAAGSGDGFIHKIGIVLKESCESNYCLRVLDTILNESSKTDVLKPILNESFEFKKIFSSIKSIANKNLKEKNNVEVM